MNKEECLGELSSIFIQVGCVLPDDSIHERQVGGLYIACLAVFLALFIITYFDYVKKTQEYNYVEWDVKTITAADYTIEFAVPYEFFEEWLDKEAEPYLDHQLRTNGK